MRSNTCSASVEPWTHWRRWRSAEVLGLTRQEALEQMRGPAFVEARRRDMERSFDRHEKLAADLAALEGHGSFMRAYHAARLTDPEIARGTLAAFRPSLPLSLEGGLFAVIGFMLGALPLRLLAILLSRVGRRRAKPA
jgi:hypothetical protein